MAPLRTTRLVLRQMAMSDLDDMAALLGDARVMRYYPAPKTRKQAEAWIAWNLDNYTRYGFGLWLVQTLDGAFVGDCGLTMQDVDGQQEVEVGYHVRAELQGQGFATEAALKCRDHATALGFQRLVAIINPANIASQRVAIKLGMQLEKISTAHGGARAIYATEPPAPTS